MNVSAPVGDAADEQTAASPVPDQTEYLEDSAGPEVLSGPTVVHLPLTISTGSRPLTDAIEWVGPLATEDDGPSHPSIGFVKRAFDVAVAVLATVAVLPVLIMCCLAILLESGRPVFFRQRRLGLGGTPFTILKFRTMVSNAESVLEQHLRSNPQAQREWDADRKLRKDPRVLRIGKLMRRFSLDELPQLWNILTGDMSLVGPRPIVNEEIVRYRGAYRDYCKVRPGLTGLWQVSGRNDTGYAERITLDRSYVERWSFWLDLSIVARTVRVVIKSTGAY